MALNKKRIPNAKERLELEAANAAADIADQQQKAGIPQSMTGETGMDRNGRVIDVTGFSDQKKWWAQDRQDTARELGGFKSFGDKSAFESKNAVRKLQGLPPLDANPVTQFVNDLDRSMTFLDKSALLTPEGQQRALKAGVAAGLSFEDADAAVQSAFATLQKRQKGATPTASVGPPPKELANVAAAPTATPAAPKPPSATQIATAETPTETPEQNVKEAVSEAVGLNEEGRNAALQAAQGGRLAANLMREYSKGAINKEVDAIAGAGGRTRTSLGRESKSLLEAYNKAKDATVKMQQLAKGATEGSPLSKGIATVTQKATEAGTKSTEGLKALQAAAERSGAQKAADLGRKVLGSRVLKGVGRIGGIAQIAEPLLEVYKYNKNPELFDQKVDEIIERNEAGLLPTIGAAVRDVAPTPLQFFNPNYSPIGTMAATTVAPLEQQRRLIEAQGELAFQKGAAEIARRRGDELTQQRRSMVSDEDYAKMSAEQKRESSMKAAEALRQLREAARKRKQ